MQTALPHSATLSLSLFLSLSPPPSLPLSLPSYAHIHESIFNYYFAGFVCCFGISFISGGPTTPCRIIAQKISLNKHKNQHAYLNLLIRTCTVYIRSCGAWVLSLFVCYRVLFRVWVCKLKLLSSCQLVSCKAWDSVHVACLTLLHLLLLNFICMMHVPVHVCAVCVFTVTVSWTSGVQF